MRINLRIKLIALIIVVVGLVLIILLFQATSREREVFQTAFREKTMILAMALDAGIASREELKEVSELQSDIYKFIWLYPDLVKISVSLPAPEGFKIVASNKTEEIGNLAGIESIISYQEGRFLTRTLFLADGTEVSSAITPIHVGGQRVGTYEIELSLEAEKKAILHRQREVAIVILFSIGVIIAALSFLLNRMVVIPIAEIKKGLQIIGEGQSKWRITPRSEDEIGEVAREFNKMTEKLKESKEGLEEAKESLETKVKERTKELQKRVDELERFHRVTVEREMKMIELKKEIESLKKKVGEKGRI
ncbi:MAG: HAMP domain-containing protein [Patescibacteria group bacterium]